MKISVGSLVISIKKARERGPEWYDSFASRDHYRVHYTDSEYYFLWSVIADRIVNANAKSVLDIGCGSGQLAVLLHDKGVRNYHGIDFSPEFIELAKQRGLNFDFTLADVFKTDLLETVQYDTIIATEFLEHVKEDIAVIGRIRPGTRCYATVPNFPFHAHVRHFKSATEVHDRYSKYFEKFRVDSFLANDKGKTYYLLEGEKIP
ncbi:MAG: class I SAM-dependent methyltransferase [Syntrophobacterales bacterium]